MCSKYANFQLHDIARFSVGNDDCIDSKELEKWFHTTYYVVGSQTQKDFNLENQN